MTIIVMGLFVAVVLFVSGWLWMKPKNGDAPPTPTGEETRGGRRRYDN